MYPTAMGISNGDLWLGYDSKVGAFITPISRGFMVYRTSSYGLWTNISLGHRLAGAMNQINHCWWVVKSGFYHQHIQFIKERPAWSEPIFNVGKTLP